MLPELINIVEVQKELAEYSFNIDGAQSTKHERNLQPRANIDMEDEVLYHDRQTNRQTHTHRQYQNITLPHMWMVMNIYSDSDKFISDI